MVRFSQDIITLSDLKMNPGQFVRQITKTQRPALITQRGRGVAVMQTLEQYEAMVQELESLRRRINDRSNHNASQDAVDC